MHTWSTILDIPYFLICTINLYLMFQCTLIDHSKTNLSMAITFCYRIMHGYEYGYGICCKCPCQGYEARDPRSQQCKCKHSYENHRMRYSPSPGKELKRIRAGYQRAELKNFPVRFISLENRVCL